MHLFKARHICYYEIGARKGDLIYVMNADR